MVYGDKREFFKLKKKLREQKPTLEVVNYLQKRSKECLDYAVNCFNQYVIDSNALELTLNNLTYVLSFNEFAERYKQECSVLTLDQIDNFLLNKIRRYIKLIENGEERLNKEKVKKFILEVKKNLKLYKF